MTKLLDKPFKAFTIYSLIILICSIPIYYWAVDYIWSSELDEHNQIIKSEIQHQLDQWENDDSDLDLLIENWNIIRPEAKLTAINYDQIKSDSTYEVELNSAFIDDSDMERFRILLTYLEINDTYYQLLIQTNIDSGDETILSIALVTLLFFILLIAGFIILNKRISIQLWKPFQATLRQLKAFDLSREKHIEFQPTDIEEFDELNQTLKKLMEKNITVYKQQKTFIENASHELQTPIALIKSKLDIYYQNPKLSKGQSEMLDALQLPISRLARINKNLLLLAKLDHSDFKDISKVDFNMLIDESLNLFSDYIEERELDVQKSGTDILDQSCNSFLVETLLQNLLSNAIKYAPIGGSIHIELAPKKFTILNDGTESLKQSMIFERFASVSASQASSGLGLAIVKEICIRYNWQPKYEFINGLQTFSIEF